MGTIHGKNGVVKVGTDAVAEVQNFQVTTNVETAEDTAMGDTWKSHLVGVKGWQGSLSCSYDPADTDGQGALVEGASVTLNLYPAGAGVGALFVSGTATITEVTRNVQRAGVVERSFNFMGNGALTEDTVGA